MTIPNDVLQWLRSIHPDPGWAIVSLHERLVSGKVPKQLARMPDAELVRLTKRQSMIVVNPSTFRSVKGISVLPNAGGRAFLALQNGQGIADLELVISDCLEADALSRSEREALIHVREQVREWRRSPSWRVESKSIILIAHRPEPRKARPHGTMRELNEKK